MEFYSDKLIELRKLYKLKYNNIAEFLDKSRQTISNWEHKLTNPSKTDVIALAYLFKVKISDLSSYEDLKDLSEHNIDDTVKEDKYFSNFENIKNKYKNLPSEIIAEMYKLCETNAESTRENQRLIREINGSNLILNSNNFIIYKKNKDRILKNFNSKFLNLLPHIDNKDNIKGKKMIDFFGFVELEKIITLENQVFESGCCILDKEIIIPGTKGKKIGLISIYPLYNENNKIENIVSSIKDITKFSTTISQLDNLKQAIDLSDEIIIIKNIKNGNNEYVSRNIENLIGYDIDKFYNDKYFWYSIVHPDDLHLAKPYDKLLKNGGTDKYRIIHKEGRTVWIEVRRYVKYDNINGRTFRFGIIRDITEEKNQEAVFNLLKTGFNKAPFSIWLFDKHERKNLFISNSINKIYGYPASNFYKNYNFWKKCLVPADQVKYVQEGKNRMLPSKRKYRIVRSNGDIRHISEINICHDKFEMGIEIDVTDEIENKIKDYIEKLYENNNCDGISIRSLESNKYIYFNNWILNKTGITANVLKKDNSISLEIPENLLCDEDKNDARKFNNHEINKVNIQLLEHGHRLESISIKRKYIELSGQRCEQILWNDLTIEEEQKALIATLSTHCEMTSNDAVVIDDGHPYRYLFMNNKFIELAGHSKEFINSINFSSQLFARERVHTDDRLKYLEGIQKGHKITNYRIITKKGELRYIKQKLKFLRKKWTITIFIDVTSSQNKQKSKTNLKLA
ncbi:MAG: PAS domain-containing protein [bacterium]|nr:PAS domain-containing protein [bacterium]